MPPRAVAGYLNVRAHLHAASHFSPFVLAELWGAEHRYGVFGRSHAMEPRSFIGSARFITAGGLLHLSVSRLGNSAPPAVGLGPCCVEFLWPISAYGSFDLSYGHCHCGKMVTTAIAKNKVVLTVRSNTPVNLTTESGALFERAASRGCRLPQR